MSGFREHQKYSFKKFRAEVDLFNLMLYDTCYFYWFSLKMFFLCCWTKQKTIKRLFKGVVLKL